MRLHITTLFIVLICLPLGLYAQVTAKTALVIKKTNNFDVTGSGSADAWNNTDWVTLEKRKGQATYVTQAKLLYSDTGIYALFSCDDSKITSTLQKDFANLWTEDVVEIFFWPDESVPLYFEYELSPRNHELAILVPNMDGDFLGWTPWQYEGERKTRHAVEVKKDKSGKTTEWMAEFFIPFSLLKPLRNVPPQAGTEWRMNLYRIDYDDQYTSWSWQPVAKNFHDYENFGLIRFE
ncbi:MAG TPA: carbohydrate-binding family 9-like protein [Chryseosolibacter sp.]